MKWLKVPVGMKQIQFSFDAKGGYEHIDGFAYGDTSFTQQTEVICKGARVNLTFYPESESIAGIVFEVMNVVRIRRS